MVLQLMKWGNSLAIRLPASQLRAAGLGEGDEVDAEFLPNGEIRLVPARSFDKEAFMARLKRLHAQLPATRSTVEDMRAAERY